MEIINRILNKISVKQNTTMLIFSIMVLTVAILLQNYLTVGLIFIPFTNIIMPGGAEAGIAIVVITDVISQVWGKDISIKVKKMSYIIQIVALLFTIPTLYLLRTPSPDTIKLLQSVIGTSYIIFISSVIAYIISQSTDIYVFYKIRDFLNLRMNNPYKLRILCNIGSNIASQVIDAIVFTFLSFLLLPTIVNKLGFFEVIEILSLSDMFQVCIGVYVFRFPLLLISAFITYILTWYNNGDGKIK